MTLADHARQEAAYLRQVIAELDRRGTDTSSERAEVKRYEQMEAAA